MVNQIMCKMQRFILVLRGLGTGFFAILVFSACSSLRGEIGPSMYGEFCGVGHPRPESFGSNFTNLPFEQRLAIFKGRRSKDDIDEICKQHDICTIEAAPSERLIALGKISAQCSQQVKNRILELANSQEITIACQNLLRHFFTIFAIPELRGRSGSPPDTLDYIVHAPLLWVGQAINAPFVAVANLPSYLSQRWPDRFEPCFRLRPNNRPEISPFRSVIPRPIRAATQRSFPSPVTRSVVTYAIPAGAPNFSVEVKIYPPNNRVDREVSAVSLFSPNLIVLFYTVYVDSPRGQISALAGSLAAGTRATNSDADAAMAIRLDAVTLRGATAARYIGLGPPPGFPSHLVYHQIAFARAVRLQRGPGLLIYNAWVQKGSLARYASVVEDIAAAINLD